MLYLIGGVPRAGKSKLVEQLEAQGVHGLNTDYIRDMLCLQYTDEAITLAYEDRLDFVWPYLKSLILILTKRYSKDYYLEGDLFHPNKLAELDLLPDKVKAIFLGYAGADVDQKVADIRNYPTENEWTDEKSDDELRNMVQGLIQQSAEIKRLCDQHGFLYIDTATEFEEKINNLLAN